MENNKPVPVFIWINNRREGQRWPLHRSLSIGRENADVNLPVEAVSRRHALVHVADGQYTLEDSGSRNGTAVNGRLLNAGEQHALRDGDVVLLAGMVELKFIDPLATPLAPRIGRLRGLWIDNDNGDVWIDARKVEPALSGKQQALLQLIYQADGKVVGREQIVATVWSYASPEGISNDAVDSLNKRLRKKLAEYSAEPLLELVRDQGIRLVQP